MQIDGNCQPQQQPDGLVAGSVDLVTMLLKVRYASLKIHLLFASFFPSSSSLSQSSPLKFPV